MAAPTNYDQTNEWLAEVDRRVQELVNLLKAGIDVGQSGQLGNLALINALSEAQIGDLPAFQTSLQVQHVAGRETVGRGPRLMLEGAAGWGSDRAIELDGGTSDGSQNLDEVIRAAVYRLGGSAVNAFPGQASGDFAMHFGWSSTIWGQLGMGAAGGDLHVRSRFSGNITPWGKVYSTNNTTVDSNGFVKEASPIFRLANIPAPALTGGTGFSAAGAGAVNSQALGVTATHDDVGVYTVHGSLGFATEGWTVEVPQCINGNRQVFIETEHADDGTITVRTFKPKPDLETLTFVAGEPMDIPNDRWIDLRLSMPEPDEPEPEQTDPTTAA